jgi:hypothetical protein
MMVIKQTGALRYDQDSSNPACKLQVVKEKKNVEGWIRSFKIPYMSFSNTDRIFQKFKDTLLSYTL